jgi:predicted phosphatase
MEINEDFTLENTLLEDYDTLILDADGVIFDAFSNAGDSIGCYKTIAPYKLLQRDIVKDINSNIIRLQQHLRDFLEVLDNNNINLGICSRGEKRNTPFAAQPTTMLLKKFDIYKYFNLDIVLKEGINKYEYVKPLGKTLFIDDQKDQLQNVSMNSDIDILNRRSFDDWLQLFQPKKQSSLYLGLTHFDIIRELKVG